MKNSPQNSNDLEWDNDFISAEDLEREQLLSQPLVNRWYCANTSDVSNSLILVFISICYVCF